MTNAKMTVAELEAFLHREFPQAFNSGEIMIESADARNRWSTIGVSPNIVDASYNALYDAITYKLFRDGAKPAAAA